MVFKQLTFNFVENQECMEPAEAVTLREQINERFRTAVYYLLENKYARNKNEIMTNLGLYLGRLSLLLERKANVSTDNLCSLSRAYGVSTDYLLLGVGPIVKSDNGSEMTYGDNRPNLVERKGFLPLIPITAIAGFNGVDANGVRFEDCVNYYVPEFADAGADFLIRIKGSSMVPTYISGDLVACQRANTNMWLDYGEVYIVDSQQGAMLKRIFQDIEDESILICKSDNTDVAPFKIRKNEIRSLSKVLGVIRSA